MTIDTLADLLKSRGATAVSYFHTDHFEPWSTSIDETSARAVERMAAMARRSPYARRLSLFYSVFIPYRPTSEGPPGPDDSMVPGDGVVFCGRSARQEELAREVIRPLLLADRHEMHLHVHHEYWTRNSSRFDSATSRWVNACSTPHADDSRLDLHFDLAGQAIAREIGAPFERWAFIHGNWALNASDPQICQVGGEMAMIMRHGGFGDFSFPAGRSYCDPELKRPFTCLPLDLPRAYDDRRADPRPVDRDTAALAPERFFIWNAPIRSVDSSLDYYSATNRALFKTPERVVATWLAKSVCLGDRLYIKTHAHSMKADYRLAEADSYIPHCHPDIVAIFDCLARVCDRAGVELQFHTVNDVMEILGALDGGREAPVLERTARPVEAAGDVVMPATGAAPLEAPLPPVAINAMVHELATLHRTWKAGEGARFGVDALYEAKLEARTPLEGYEVAIATEIGERFPAISTRVIEIGSGWGGLSILLARMGFEVYAFEGNAARHAAAQWHFDEQIRRHPALRGRLLLAPEGMFPQVFFRTALAKDKINLGVATNITSTYSSDNQDAIVEAATQFDEMILDLGRFGRTRDSQAERAQLRATLATDAFRPVERLYFQPPYEYWRLRSRMTKLTARRATTETSILPTGSLFSVFGDRRLPDCPVCRSVDIVPLWRMPMTDLEEPLTVFGGYFTQIPTLQVPATLFCFDFCESCESIFLNPVPSRQKDGYRTTDHYIRKMRSAAEWKGYGEVYRKFARWIPEDGTVMIDAACGIGQYLHVARERGKNRWQRLIGLELSEKYVEHMNKEGLEAHVFDIDADELGGIVAPGSVDFVSFCEAFEHVERPIDGLRKLLAALRPGGRLFFTAQRYGRDVKAAVRPGEPIYIGQKVIDELPRLGCRIVDMTTSDTRYFVVLEK